MIFTRDFVTRENYWQIASLVTQKSLFTVTHALFFMLKSRDRLIFNIGIPILARRHLYIETVPNFPAIKDRGFIS